MIEAEASSLPGVPQRRKSERATLSRLRQSLNRNRPRTFVYENQESTQSLRQGLEEYYSSDSSLLAPKDVSSDIAIGLRAHDASHVVFGCDTSIRGEVALARWSLFGAKGAMSLYLRGLRSRETRFLFVDFVRKVRLETLLCAAVDGFRAIMGSLRMQQRWPTLGWERYADRPLNAIRAEFGIRVV